VPLEGHPKAFANGAQFLLAGGTAVFAPIRVPSPPQLDDGALPTFSHVYLFATVTTDGVAADLTLTGNYPFTPTKNGTSAAFTVAANGLTICVRQPAAPGARLGLTIVSAGGVGNHNLNVSWGAHAAPSFVELDKIGAE
jgi:hypothetical protein